MKPDELKDHRKRLNLTQKELAKELCVTVRAVVSWETGTRNMPLSVEKLFCLLFDLPFRIRRSPVVDDQTPDLF
jgi:transcriptional regulator with XRE-family HTH domain